MRPQNPLFATLTLLLTSLGAAASAQDLPPSAAEPETATPATLTTAYTGRSITPTAGTFSLIAGPLSNLDLTLTVLEGGLNYLVLQDYEICFFGSCTIVEIDNPLFLLVGGAYGITDDLEIGALVLPLELSPDFEYGDPAIWGRYRLLPGDIEVAAQAMVWFPVSSSQLVLELGAPVRFHGLVRVDTGLYLTIDTDPDFGMRVPLTLTANVTESIFLGGRTGLSVPHFGSEGVIVPLQFVGGYTIASGAAPAADITLAAGFPYFIVTGGRSGYDEIVTEIFQVSIGANVYFGI